tara:strand:+ start:1283 stop:1831 length:549 start_codon:yes stop_codon:yes gene_type:complete
MSATNFPTTPKNILTSSPPEKEKSVIDENQVKFHNALNKAFDILFYQMSHNMSNGDKRVKDGEHPLKHVWQDKVCEHETTPLESRKIHPQLYLRWCVGDHTDLLNGPAGAEIEIPLNKKSEPIKFTASTILSKNCNDFRQYIKDQGYLPEGLCLLVFRQKHPWTYSIVITRDNKGPAKCEWD